MFISNKIDLNVPVEKVYDFIADFENIPRWNYYVVKVQKLERKDGKHYRQTRKEDRQTFRVVQETRPEKIKIETTSANGIQFSREFLLLDNQRDGCVLEDHFYLDLDKPVIVQRIFKPRIKQAVRNNLRKLKQLLEQGSVVLQDGRTSYLNIA
jgi:uncharacterized membrane protein